MANKSFPLNIYKVKLLKLNSYSGNHSSEYVVTENHGNYKRGDIVVIDEDNTVISIDRGRNIKSVRTPTSTPKYGPNLKHKEYNLSKSSSLLSNLLSNLLSKLSSLSNKSTTTKKPITNSNKFTSRKLRSLVMRKNKRVVAANYSIPKNDLSFINLYVLAYQNREQDPKKYNAFNRALSRNPNKKLIWKGIWGKMDSSHTPELSKQQHNLLFTINPGKWNEMGQTNWYNIFNGNLLHATADDLSIPRSSLDYLSPELRAKTILLTSNPQYTVQTSSVQTPDNIDNIIMANNDLFRNQYEYAKLHNGAFDYTPTSFDTSNLNVNYKYGGIGDFMDTYGLNPKGLYERLDKIYSTKYLNGGKVNKNKEKADAVKTVTSTTLKNINIKEKDTPLKRQLFENQRYTLNMLKFTTDYLNLEASYLYGKPYKGYYYHGFNSNTRPTPTSALKIKNDLVNLYRYFFDI